MNYEELRDLVEKKKAARRALARKQRKQALPPTNPAPAVEKPETKPEEVAEETKVAEVAEAPVVEATEAPAAEATEAPVAEDPDTEVAEAPKKKWHKKKRRAEVADGAAE